MGAPKGNKYAVGNSGKPPKYDNADDLFKAVDSYFTYIQGEYKEEEVEIKQKDGTTKKEINKIVVRYPEPPTVTGLALHIGFASRQSIYDYIKDDEFSYILKRAITVIENHHEKKMSYDKVTGSIFVLKNMGWKDKTEIDQTSTHTVTWNEEKTYNP